MIHHILFFHNTASRYDVLPYFTTDLMHALMRAGVTCEPVIPDRGNIFPFLQKVYRDSPDCTLCFNGLLPDEDERFLADMIGIPHVACLVDSINWFFSLLQSPYYIITCPDWISCKMLESLNFKNWIYMPHGVDANIELPNEEQRRPYDVVFFGTCIDFKSIQEKWRKEQPKKIVEALEAAAFATLSSPSISYQEALLSALNETSQDITSLEISTLFGELDQYIRGKDRTELISSVRDVPVHIFGSSLGSLSWKKQLDGRENIIFHDPIFYPEVLDVMKKSKIVLNSSPMFKYGGHERIFAGLACGALTLTNETAYMLDNFQKDQNIALYKPMHWDEINDYLMDSLNNEDKRRKIAEEGRNKVMKQHTWDHRAAQLLKDLEPILNRLSESL